MKGCRRRRQKRSLTERWHYRKQGLLCLSRVSRSRINRGPVARPPVENTGFGGDTLTFANGRRRMNGSANRHAKHDKAGREKM
jgi:hypothetical protein